MARNEYMEGLPPEYSITRKSLLILLTFISPIGLNIWSVLGIESGD